MKNQSPLLGLKVNLTETQSARLKEISGQYQKSVAALIRQSIDTFIAAELAIQIVKPAERLDSFDENKAKDEV